MKCLRHIPMAEVMPPMLRLLLQPEPQLQRSALKALSNLVLDTASAKVMTNPPAISLGEEEFLPLVVKLLSCLSPVLHEYLRSRHVLYIF